MSGPVTLDDLLDLVRLLAEDRGRDADVLARRDRALGRAVRTDDPPALLQGWLRARRTEAGSPRTHARLALGVPLVLLALLAGWGTALAVFFYDGGGRVNVVAVLAVFVLAQALLLAAFALAALPPAWRRRLPGVDMLGRMATLFSPARLARLLVRRLPAAVGAHLAPLLGDGDRRVARLAPAARWLLLALSQQMALAFNVAAVLTALALVVFTDLAFGWATTLAPGDDGFHALLATLATPWAAAWPAAVPDLELVAASRYFRLADSGADAAVLTRWWPFLLAAMLVYGVLPRLLTVALAEWRLRAAVRSTLFALPEVDALLDRLRAPRVETAADTATAPAPAAAPPATGGVDAVSLPAPVTLVDWADLPLDRDRLAALLGDRFGFTAATVLAAGGNRTLAEDEATARAAAGAGSVVVACKAWEPPLLDLVDFVAAVRAAAAAATPIAVVPVALDGDRLATPRPRDVEQWRHLLAGNADPHLHLLRTHVEGVA